MFPLIFLFLQSKTFLEQKSSLYQTCAVHNYFNHNSVISSLSDDVAYEMKWFLSRLRGSNSAFLLASMDRWGIVRKAPRNDSSDCSLERLGPRRFALNIHSTQDSDAGGYYCTTTPWIRSTTTGVWSKAPEVTSQRVFLNVKFACE